MPIAGVSERRAEHEQRVSLCQARSIATFRSAPIAAWSRNYGTTANAAGTLGAILKQT